MLILKKKGTVPKVLAIVGIVLIAWALRPSVDGLLGDAQTLGTGIAMVLLARPLSNHLERISVSIAPQALIVRNGREPIEIPIDSARVLLVREEDAEYVGIRELIPDNYMSKSRAMYIEHDEIRTPVVAASGLMPERFVQLGVDIEMRLSEARYRRDNR